MYTSASGTESFNRAISSCVPACTGGRNTILKLNVMFPFDLWAAGLPKNNGDLV